MNPASETIQFERDHYAAVYQKLPLEIERGRGALVWDSTGKEYVDCMAGYGVALTGHCNPVIVSAV
ncbi:MAG TPA: aminotransferase class III-fold pyridoxal phosphate-dependent enzyme, partial [Candidatus Binatus sp.]|nr:aminotransferase class III-fold pyridoxal phosphate-dependent enzyme [Candidatus Binatus sp.]